MNVGAWRSAHRVSSRHITYEDYTLTASVLVLFQKTGMVTGDLRVGVRKRGWKLGHKS